MTISEEQTRYIYAGPYAVGETAPIPFTYAEPEDVKARRDTLSLEINVDYSVDGQNVTLLVPIATGENLVIYRETPLDNESEFPQEAPFDSEKINDALDKLTMQNQEQEEDLLRAVKLPLNAPTELGQIDLPLPEANKGIKWDPTGTKLENTEHDLDDIADLTGDYLNDAKEQALIATQKAQEATDAASLAQTKAQETVVAAEQALEDINAAVTEGIDMVDTAAETASQGVIDSINTAKTNAIAEVEASGEDTIALAKSWAIGTITERPEGSAQWWANQTKQEIQGEVYTEQEIDAMLLAYAKKTEVTSEIETAVSTKQDALTAGSGITITDNTIAASMTPDNTYTKTQMDEALAQKQPTLIAGSGIEIDPNNVISCVIEPVAVDAYTKAETDALLAGKQDALTAGENIVIADGEISATVDAYTKVETQGLLSVKQNKLTAGDYITIENNIISSDPESMIQAMYEADWNALSPEEKAAIKLALIYEET